MMVTTLIEASQNSVSPNDLAESRLLAVSRSIRPSASAQSGAGSHPLRMRPPTTASKATTPTQKYQ
jgi:hypothetical protein